MNIVPNLDISNVIPEAYIGNFALVVHNNVPVSFIKGVVEVKD